MDETTEDNENTSPTTVYHDDKAQHQSTDSNQSSPESLKQATIDVNHYAYRVRWNEDDGNYIASCAELPGIIFTSNSQLEAFVGIRSAVAQEMERRQLQGETMPVPLAERHYSGRILVRVPPELHRRLTIDAAEQNVSLNRLISNRLAEL